MNKISTSKDGAKALRQKKKEEHLHLEGEEGKKEVMAKS